MSELNANEQVNEFRSKEQYLTFNILGKNYRVKKSLFDDKSHILDDPLFTKFDQNRQQYIIDISPLIFESILEYYKTQKLHQPSNIHIDYFKATLERFHIDTSSLDINQQHVRFVPKNPIFQIIHILLEYPDCNSNTEFFIRIIFHNFSSLSIFTNT